MKKACSSSKFLVIAHGQAQKKLIYIHNKMMTISCHLTLQRFLQMLSRILNAVLLASCKPSSCCFHSSSVQAVFLFRYLGQHNGGVSTCIHPDLLVKAFVCFASSLVEQSWSCCLSVLLLQFHTCLK